VACTQTLDENYEAAIEFDSSNEVVGIELVAPSDETIALASRFALDHGLSLAGVFDPRAIGV
jgi:hypothetical protein